MRGAAALALDPEERRRVADGLLSALEAAVPGSTARLRGSMAAGTADDYSDVDVRWEVPAPAFGRACAGLGANLSRVKDLASLRFDPDASDPGRRLAFARFAGWPLFWRVDLEIASTGGPPATAPPTAAPSHTHSALMCAVGAIRAFLRGRPEEGAQLVSRGYARVHLPVPSLPARAQILALAESIYDADDTHAELADEVRRLYREAFDEGDPP